MTSMSSSSISYRDLYETYPRNMVELENGRDIYRNEVEDGRARWSMWLEYDNENGKTILIGHFHHPDRDIERVLPPKSQCLQKRRP